MLNGILETQFPPQKFCNLEAKTSKGEKFYQQSFLKQRFVLIRVRQLNYHPDAFFILHLAKYFFDLLKIDFNL